jgi:hypothetical protein
MSQDCHIVACCLPLAAGEDSSPSVLNEFYRPSNAHTRLEGSLLSGEQSSSFEDQNRETAKT